MSSRSQSHSKRTKVRLKSFNGTAIGPPEQRPSENYWLLIGEEGVVVEPKNEKSRLLIQFSVPLGSLGLHNHNPVPNTLFILESDLESF
jgi:acetylornithine/N-succinyldiaminopimelate aminotransferase